MNSARCSHVAGHTQGGTVEGQVAAVSQFATGTSKNDTTVSQVRNCCRVCSQTTSYGQTTSNVCTTINVKSTSNGCTSRDLDVSGLQLVGSGNTSCIQVDEVGTSTTTKDIILDAGHCRLAVGATSTIIHKQNVGINQVSTDVGSTIKVDSRDINLIGRCDLIQFGVSNRTSQLSVGDRARQVRSQITGCIDQVESRGVIRSTQCQGDATKRNRAVGELVVSNSARQVAGSKIAVERRGSNNTTEVTSAALDKGNRTNARNIDSSKRSARTTTQDVRLDARHRGLSIRPSSAVINNQEVAVSQVSTNISTTVDVQHRERGGDINFSRPGHIA